MLNSCIVYRASIHFIFSLFLLGLEEPFCNGLEQNLSLQEWVRIYFFILRRIRRGTVLLDKLEEREGSARITYLPDCCG